MTEYPAPVADIMDAESVRAELAEVEARAEKLRAVLAVGPKCDAEWPGEA